MGTTDKAKLLKRIADLKRMAERGKDDEISREEAARAAEKIQELLLKYNLDMADVPLEQQGPTEQYGRETFGLGKRHGTDWRRLLIIAVAKTNFVHVVFYHGSNRTTGPMVHLIGLPTNVEVVKDLYSWLAENFDFTATLAAAIRQETWTPSATWKDSFLRAAVQMVSQRLRDQRKAAESQGDKVTALVRRTDIELADATKRFIGGTVPIGIDRQGGFSPEGHTKGLEHGRNVNLGRPTHIATPSGGRQMLGDGRR